MLTGASNPKIHSLLRRQAETRLREGTAPKAKVAATSFDALEVLESMTTAPGGASAVLKVLHELQVHQVELDLQQEQLELNQDELSNGRDDYVERFDFAPIANFVVGQDGKIIEANLAAAELFGLERAALSGRRLDSLVARQAKLDFLSMLTKLCSGSIKERCVLQIQKGRDVVQRYRVIATVAPSGRFLFGMFVDHD